MYLFFYLNIDFPFIHHAMTLNTRKSGIRLGRCSPQQKTSLTLLEAKSCRQTAINHDHLEQLLLTLFDYTTSNSTA